MIYYNDEIFSRKVIYRLICKLEHDGMTSTTFTEIEILGFRKIFDETLKKISVYFPRYGNGYAENDIVYTLVIFAIIEILKRSMSTKFVDMNFQVEYTKINHRMQLIWY